MRGSGERSRQPLPPLPKLAAPHPERHQRASQFKRTFRVVAQRDIKRKSQVLLLLLEPVEIVVPNQRVVEAVLGDRGVVVKVATPQVVGLAGRC